MSVCVCDPYFQAVSSFEAQVIKVKVKLGRSLHRRQT